MPYEIPSISTDEYLVWEHPTQALTVLFKAGLIDRLEAVVREAADSRGQEVTGILLGRLDTENAGRSVLTIDDSEPPSEDRKHLAQRIRAWKRFRDSDLRPVGIIRSHLRKGLQPDDVDLALFRGVFSAPSSVCLLVKPLREEVPVAEFFFWDREAGYLEPTVKAFPLDREKLTEEGYFMLMAPPAAAPAPAGAAPEPSRRTAFSSVEATRIPAAPPPHPVRAREAAVATAHAPKRPASRPGWLIPALIAMMLIPVALWFGLRHWEGSAPGGSADLALEAARNGRELHLSWNPMSSPVERANRGILWIVDGNRNTRMDLTPEQLAAGKAIYVPQSDDVTFRLNVFRVEDEAQASVRFLNSVVSKPPETVTPAPSGYNTADRVLPQERRTPRRRRY